MLVSVQLDGKERALTLAEFEESVRAGTIGPHTPVRTSGAEGWVEAGTLPHWSTLADSPEARFRRAWDHPRIPWMTALICGVALRIWAWTDGTPAAIPLTDLGTRWTPAILEQGEGWRLLTYGFLHANFGHVANNVLMLAYTGAALESIVGGWSVLALFLVSCLGGGLLSGWLAPEVHALGASGGDFGFLAATVVLGARYRDVIPVQARSRFGGFIFALTAWALVNGFLAEGVDNWAHLGGLLSGAAFTALLRPASDTAGARWNRRVAVGAAVGTVGVSMALALAGPWLIPYVPLAEDGVVTERPAWWEPGWSRNRDTGWTSPTRSGALSVRTVRDPDFLTADIALDELVGSYRAIDASVEVVSASVRVDGVEGRRVTLEGAGWRSEALLLVRGRYVHTVAVDLPAGRFGTVLVDRVLGSVHLRDPDAMKEAVDRGDSPRGRIARAQVLADLGRDDAALAELVGTDVATEIARLTILADARRPELSDAVERALARYPTDRRVVIAAVRAWTTVGDEAQRALLVADARRRWPGDPAIEQAFADQR